MAEEVLVMDTLDPRTLALRERIASLLAEADGGSKTLPATGSALEQVAAGVELLASELSLRRESAREADKRLSELAVMMGAMVAFDFSQRVEVTARGDIYDGFASSLNMMAEELGATTVSSEFVDNILQSMSEPVTVVDPGSRIIAVNRAACSLTGYDAASLKGRELADLFSQIAIHDIIERERLSLEETVCMARSGDRVPVSFSASVLRNKMGELQGVVCVARDLREVKKAEAERWQMREAMQRQAILLEELSTPLIPISEQIVVMPLVGTVDSSRAQQMCETLLHGVTRLRAKVAIIDVTGMRTVDQAAISGIMAAVRAVRLLGADVVLTGIRPEIAVALIRSGADLTGVATTGSLQAGIQGVVQRLDQPARVRAGAGAALSALAAPFPPPR